MDQIYSSMLYMMQTMAERPQTAQKSDQGQNQDGFRKLMDQKQPAQKNTAEDSEPQAAAGEALQTGGPVAGGDMQELEKQMALAAVAMLQNPVVPVEQTEIVPAEEIAVVPAEGETPELAPISWNAAKDAGMTNDKVRVIPVEQQTAPMEEEAAKPAGIPEESLPQTGAPKQAQAEEGFDMEVRAETGRVQAERTSETEEPAEPKEAEVETPVFKDVREIPVKVGEAPAAEESREAAPVERQIGQKLAEALKTGESRVEIQLTPANLGKVTVEMTLDKDGALHVVLHAEKSATRSLLEKSADGLMAMLGRENRQEVQVEVPRRQESQRQDFYDGRQGSENHSRQQQERRREERQSGEDFLHQLRLGLIPVDGETA